jgi:hypothetical protein
MIHSAWRIMNGWYEEDIDWNIVAYHFPDLFTDKENIDVRKTLMNWKPYAYMEVTGKVLTEDDSMVLLRDGRKERHKNDYVVISASTYDENYVKVWATLGGDRNADRKNCRQYLILREDYNSSFYVIKDSDIVFEGDN